MNRDVLFLGGIVKACDRIAGSINEGEATFMADERTQDAVILNIEIIEKATKGRSAKVKAKAPEEPWRKIAGTRDKLVHQDFGVNLDRLLQRRDDRREGVRVERTLSLARAPEPRRRGYRPAVRQGVGLVAG